MARSFFSVSFRIDSFFPESGCNNNQKSLPMQEAVANGQGISIKKTGRCPNGQTFRLKKGL